MTPRTDAAVEEYQQMDYGDYVFAEFARSLERELHASQEREKRLREALRLCVDKLDAIREALGDKHPFSSTLTEQNARYELEAK